MSRPNRQRAQPSADFRTASCVSCERLKSGRTLRRAAPRRTPVYRPKRPPLALREGAFLVLTLVVTLLDVPIVRQLVWALIHIGGALLAFRSSVLGACSATKAAMHAFSMPLRHQFKRVRIRVIEIVPP